VTDRPAAQPNASRRGNVHQESLISDEPTIELVFKARDGDRVAVEALLQRCLPDLRRWAHGRIPASARGSLDTGDLVQETVLHVLRRLDTFEPRHVGAMQAYLRQSVINRIRDEVRKVTRHPAPGELPGDLVASDTSPLEVAIREEGYRRYREALETLSPREKAFVVARIEAQWTVAEIARHFGVTSVDAARMAVGRAIKRLKRSLDDSPEAA
jgi:RNA polymerase sigma factor (sigma-70 family)